MLMFTKMTSQRSSSAQKSFDFLKQTKNLNTIQFDTKMNGGVPGLDRYHPE